VIDFATVPPFSLMNFSNSARDTDKVPATGQGEGGRFEPEIA
jgi:hypothetical protein